MMPKKKKKAEVNQREADQFEQEYKNLTGKSRGKFSKKDKGPGGKILAILVVVLLICGGIYAGLKFIGNTVSFDLIPNNVMAQGVTIAGVDVGGMNKDDAIAAVSAKAADKYTSQTMTLDVAGRTFELTPAMSGAELDVETAVEAALDLSTGKEVDILSYLSLKTDVIMTCVEEFSKFFPTEGVKSGWEITNEGDQEILMITMGTEHYDFDKDAFFEAIMEAYNSATFTGEYPCQQLNVTSVDLDAIYAEKCTDVVEAVLDPNTHEVTQSVVGYRFDLEGAREAMSTAEPGSVLAFPLAEVQPNMSTEQLKSMLFRDKLGSYTAVSSSSYNRDTNLRLACESINGTIVYPGDTFGYNAALGERTAAKGYKPAASYMGNETVNTYGGGICQPSSSLYYACLIADLEIVQRSCHGFVSSYMPLGMDATVDWNGPDFKFKNNTDYPIRIDATANGGTVTVTLIGTDVKDYYVKMEYEVLGTSYPSVKEEIVKPDSGHYDGEVKTTAYTGYTVQTYKLKYSKATDELISREKEAYSVYSKRDKVVYKLETEETEPTEETTEPTTDTTTETTTEATTTTTTETTVPSGGNSGGDGGNSGGDGGSSGDGSGSSGGDSGSSGDGSGSSGGDSGSSGGGSGSSGGGSGSSGGDSGSSGGSSGSSGGDSGSSGGGSGSSGGDSGSSGGDSGSSGGSSGSSGGDSGSSGDSSGTSAESDPVSSEE